MMNENNNDAPHRAGAKKGPRSCFTGCLAFYKCRKRIRDTEMARHRRRVIFTFAESVFRFRFTYAEINSAYVAKPPNEGGAELGRRSREPLRRTADGLAEGKGRSPAQRNCGCRCGNTNARSPRTRRVRAGSKPSAYLPAIKQRLRERRICNAPQDVRQGLGRENALALLKEHRRAGPHRQGPPVLQPRAALRPRHPRALSRSGQGHRARASARCARTL